ncbi:hypothetical protein GOC74_06900 [Halomicrobium mukohataei]|uniref:Uncharacterized protein n=1 Tax=Halomicrobium mukohataei TaxID=57705 RepID=A0A847UAY1_9EURY|nr:hypothetical protein [Halomicrobium mukohataei]NLV09656.1 hypothetical protein [Halomicrobium mukohataei]
MGSDDSSPWRLVVLAGLVLGGAALLAWLPALSVRGVRVPTGVALGLVAGLALVPSIVSHHRSGETREAVQWGLFAIGVPLSLTQQGLLTWVGVAAVIFSVGVGQEVDRRLTGGMVS